jgi:chaperonin cofactor prefoldin
MARQKIEEIIEKKVSVLKEEVAKKQKELQEIQASIIMIVSVSPNEFRLYFPGGI